MSTRTSASRSCSVPTKSVWRPRWLCVAIGTSSRIRSTSSVVEAGLEQPLGRAVAHEALRARAGVDPGRLDADDAARSRLGRGRDPAERHHLLRREPGHRRARGGSATGRESTPRRGARPGARRRGSRCAPRAPRRGAPRARRRARSPPRRARGSATCGRPSGRRRGRPCSR